MPRPHLAHAARCLPLLERVRLLARLRMLRRMRPEKGVEIEDQWVHFEIRHVFHPTPEDLLLELFGSRLLQGRVLTTTAGGGGVPYVAVAVAGSSSPVVVPAARVSRSLIDGGRRSDPRQGTPSRDGSGRMLDDHDSE